MSSSSAGWFEVRIGVWACAPPKCGGTALYRVVFGLGDEIDDRHVRMCAEQALALNGEKFLTATEVVERPGKRYMALRDPVSRFASLWRDKCRGFDENMPWLRGLTPDALMDAIEESPDGNAHWLPQKAFCAADAKLVPYRDLLFRLGLEEIVANQTKVLVSDPGMPEARILKHYANDLRLLKWMRRLP